MVLADGKKANLTDYFNANAQNYDSFIFLMTFGSDHIFKQELLNMIPHGSKYRSILEIAAGTGILTIPLAEQFPEAEIVAVDIAPEYLEINKRKAGNLGLTNISYLVGDASHIDSVLPNGYKADLIVGTMFPKYLNDCYDDTCTFTMGLKRISHNETLILLQDISIPENDINRMVYANHVNFVTTVAELDPKWNTLAHDLKVLAKNNWVKQLPKALAHAGFYQVYTKKQPMEISTIISAKE